MGRNQLSADSRQLVIDRIPDYDILSEEDRLAEVLGVISKDFYLYCEKNLQIVDKDGEVVTLKPNWAQKILVDEVLQDIAHERPSRYIILKARQMGLSTIIEALGYWWTATHKNVRSVIMAHEKKSSEELYQMFRNYYEYSDPLFKPSRKYATKDAITFDVDDTIKEEREKQGLPPLGLASRIRIILPSSGAGRGHTIRFYHGSEVASWDDSADVVSSAMQAIPLRKNTFAFLESTANGIGGYFWSEWQNAKKGESSFKPLFFPWYKDPEYQLEGNVSDYTEEEQELIDLMREEGIEEELFPKKILWMRAKRREFTNEPEKWYQEYPKNDMEAFLKSGRPRFDVDVLLEMQKAAEKAPAPLYGHIIKDHTKYVLRELEKKENDATDPSPLKVWHKPEKTKKYVIGVDVSEGIAIGLKNKEGDYSTIDVMDMDYRTVARWRGHIDPDALAEEVRLLGEYYNTALVGVEVNNHGLTTIQKLRDSFYRNLYMRETAEDNQFQERTSKMGWQTNIKTKRVMIDDLAQAIRENVIIDVDIVFISECMSYVVDDQGRTNAQEGMFDDTVIAKAIALQMAQWSNPLDGDLEVYKNNSRTRRHGKNEEDQWDRAGRSQGSTKRLTREAIRQQNRRRAR